MHTTADKATPRPWKVINQGPSIADVLDGHKLIIARCITCDAEQDAALIVEAVNSYDGLREENARMKASIGTLKMLIRAVEQTAENQAIRADLGVGEWEAMLSSVELTALEQAKAALAGRKGV